jgi:nucleoside-diphosphate-sugar epimerase
MGQLAAMRVLIFGCGYVGLPLAAELARRGHVVFGARRTHAADHALRVAGVEPLAADVTDPASLTRLPDPFDWVVNCVSASGGAEAYRRVYLAGTRHLLAWLASSPSRRFVYTSSTGVYGQTDGAVVTETSPAEPGTSTGDALVATEQVLLREFREHDFPAVILRVAGIYGPDRGYWLKQFLAGEARLEGDGRRVLNMIHRDDVVGAILAALERGRPGEIYNAVDDAPVTQADLFAWLAQTLNRPLPPSAPTDAATARKRGVTSKRVSNRKLREELGWRPRYPTFREGFTAELVALGPPAA